MFPMNIKTLLEQISESGMSDSAIGKSIGAPQSTVTRLRNGVHQSTSFDRGQRILALWKSRTRTDTIQLHEILPENEA